jgi:hypothetical protein
MNLFVTQLDRPKYELHCSTTERHNLARQASQRYKTA